MTGAGLVTAEVGQTLSLVSADMCYRDAPLRLRVTRVRLDISGWYDGRWVWLEGHEVDNDGYSICWQQQLVSVAALEREARHADDAGRDSSPDGGV